MTYVFGGTANDQMAETVRKLEAVQAGGEPREALFNEAMTSLVGLHVRLADAAEPRPGDSSLRDYRIQVGELLAQLSGDVYNFVEVTLFDAEAADEGDLYDLLVRRSAIQSLMDDFTRTPAEGLVDRDTVAEIDEHLRALATREGRIPTEYVPPGLPPSHWWWTYGPATGDGLSGTRVRARVRRRASAWTFGKGRSGSSTRSGSP